MKASFCVTNAFLSVLKFLRKRKRDLRYFVSADLALSWSNSSEDEVLEVEQPLCLSNNSVRHINSASIRRCNNTNPSLVRSNAVNCHPIEQSTRELGISELDLVMSILRKHGWNFECPYLYGDNLDESKVIKGLNDVFKYSSDANLALCFFRYLECGLGFKHTVSSVCTTAYILVCGNMNYKAVELLPRLIGESRSHDPQHNFLLKVLQEVCVLRNAFETLCSMVVMCYVKEKLLEVAIGLVCNMERLGIFPSLLVCNLLLSSLLRSDQEEVAWDLLEKMQSLKMVNASTISLFINYYCRKRIPGCGWKLLIDMRSFGIEPDVVSFTILIDSLCKMSHRREATLILFKMIGFGISPDAVSLSCIVDSYCKSEKRDEILRFLDFFNVPFDLYMYTSLLSMFCRAGDMVQASDTFKEMLCLGFLPDCFSYTTMIDGYCKVKDINKALQFLGRMFKVGIDPSVATYTTLINGYCGSGDLERAEFLFEEMTRKGMVPDIVVYNTLINGYGKNGQLHKAFELLDLMKAVGISPDTVTYNSLIHGLVVKGFVIEAHDLLKELLRKGFPTDTITFTSIIGGFSARGQFEEANLVWSYISKKPDVITCSALLNGYCRACHMDEATALFKRMIHAGLLPDLILYNSMIHGFCSLGNIEDAFQLLDMMVRQGIIPNSVTLQALVHGYEKRKVENPVEIAAIKLQEILFNNGL